MMNGILFIAFAATGVASIGFILGLSQNIKIDNENAVKAAIAYDCTISFKDLIVSDDKFCAIAKSNKGIILFKTMGKQIAARIISNNEVRRQDNRLEFKLNDIGFPDFKANFNSVDLDNILENKNIDEAKNA